MCRTASSTANRDGSIPRICTPRLVEEAASGAFRDREIAVSGLTDLDDAGIGKSRGCSAAAILSFWKSWT